MNDKESSGLINFFSRRSFIKGILGSGVAVGLGSFFSNLFPFNLGTVQAKEEQIVSQVRSGNNAPEYEGELHDKKAGNEEVKIYR